jgi:hypothetical protein
MAHGFLAWPENSNTNAENATATIIVTIEQSWLDYTPDEGSY